MRKSQQKNRSYLIVGGAGFIGINTADYLLSKGKRVTILDNFSRKGSSANARWLAGVHGVKARVVRADVTQDRRTLAEAVGQADTVIHLAGQVAVTTSVADPHADFITNAHGTVNVLEAVRNSRNRPSLIYASTNKVYGGMHGVRVGKTPDGYRYKDLPHGINEDFPLDFHSPYGCSKGAADQYVRDYHRIYGLKTVVCRQSCIYGPNQYGIEDQGWVAWFAIAAHLGKPITVYGDGHQARDVLHVKDLARLYELAADKIDRVQGQILNVGGGPANILSLRQTIAHLESALGRTVPVSFSDWRPGDQRIYVSDIRKAYRLLGWKPHIETPRGLKSMMEWVMSNRKSLARVLA